MHRSQAARRPAVWHEDRRPSSGHTKSHALSWHIIHTQPASSGDATSVAPHPGTLGPEQVGVRGAQHGARALPLPLPPPPLLPPPLLPLPPHLPQRLHLWRRGGQGACARETARSQRSGVCGVTFALVRQINVLFAWLAWDARPTSRSISALAHSSCSELFALHIPPLAHRSLRRRFSVHHAPPRVLERQWSCRRRLHRWRRRAGSQPGSNRTRNPARALASSEDSRRQPETEKVWKTWFFF